MQSLVWLQGQQVHQQARSVQRCPRLHHRHPARPSCTTGATGTRPRRQAPARPSGCSCSRVGGTSSLATACTHSSAQEGRWCWWWWHSPSAGCAAKEPSQHQHRQQLERQHKDTAKAKAKGEALAICTHEATTRRRGGWQCFQPTQGQQPHKEAPCAWPPPKQQRPCQQFRLPGTQAPHCEGCACF